MTPTPTTSAAGRTRRQTSSSLSSSARGKPATFAHLQSVPTFSALFFASADSPTWPPVKPCADLPPPPSLSSPLPGGPLQNRITHATPPPPSVALVSSANQMHFLLSHPLLAPPPLPPPPPLQREIWDSALNGILSLFNAATAAWPCHFLSLVNFCWKSALFPWLDSAGTRVPGRTWRRRWRLAARVLQ